MRFHGAAGHTVQYEEVKTGRCACDEPAWYMPFCRSHGVAKLSLAGASTRRAALGLHIDRREDQGRLEGPVKAIARV